MCPLRWYQLASSAQGPLCCLQMQAGLRLPPRKQLCSSAHHLLLCLPACPRCLVACRNTSRAHTRTSPALLQRSHHGPISRASRCMHPGHTPAVPHLERPFTAQEGAKIVRRAHVVLIMVKSAQLDFCLHIGAHVGRGAHACVPAGVHVHWWGSKLPRWGSKLARKPGPAACHSALFSCLTQARQLLQNSAGPAAKCCRLTMRSLCTAAVHGPLVKLRSKLWQHAQAVRLVCNREGRHCQGAVNHLLAKVWASAREPRIDQLCVAAGDPRPLLALQSCTRQALARDDLLRPRGRLHLRCCACL